MACMAAAVTAKAAVLEALRQSEYRPLKLLDKLGDRYSDSEIKQAIAELLHEGVIELTPSRMLRAAEIHAA